jgi:ferredoxin
MPHSIADSSWQVTKEVISEASTSPAPPPAGSYHHNTRTLQERRLDYWCRGVKRNFSFGGRDLQIYNIIRTFVQLRLVRPCNRERGNGMSNKPYVDQGNCFGCCDICAKKLPHVFRVGDDGVAELCDPKDAPASEKEIQDAIDNCPASCIRWQ